MKPGILAALALTVLPAAAFAAPEAAGSGTGGLFFTITVFAAGIGLAVAAFGGAIGQGMLAGRAMEAMARQPEMAARIQTAMLLGLAFVESLVIYSLLISFILLFVNPFAKFFG